MAKFYQVSKEINGVKYIAQFNGISAALAAVDNSYIDGSNNTSLAKLTNYLFQNVIVEPKNLTADSFDNMDDFNAVVAFARGVMQGEIKPAAKPEEEKKAK